MRSTRLLLIALAFLSPNAIAQEGGPGSPGTGGILPSLSISAPELGSLLTATVSGVPAGAPVGIGFAAQAGQLVTPFGTVWLDPASLSVIASGTADASGSASFSWQLPLNPGLAERELHLQAFAIDAGAASGASLSNSLDFRILGSRVYLNTFSASAPTQGMLAKSAVSGEDVFLTESPAASDNIVFDQRHARAAYVTPADVVICCNFYGDTLAVVGPAPANPRLLADPAGQFFFVNQGAQVEVVDFASASIVSTISLGSASGEWVAEEGGSLAYMLTSVAGAPAVRELDLVGQQDLGATPIGSPTDTASRIAISEGRVGVITKSATGLLRLHVLDYTGPTPTQQSVGLGTSGLSGLAAAATGGGFAAWTEDNCSPVPPFVSFDMRGGSFAAPLGHASITKPPLPMGSGCARPSSWAAQADRLWMIDHWGNEPPFGDEPGALWRLVPETGVWSLAATEPFGPLAVGVIEDAFGLRVYTSHSTPFAPAVPAGVSELDTATWTSTVLPIDIIGAPDIDDYFLHAESIP